MCGNMINFLDFPGSQTENMFQLIREFNYQLPSIHFLKINSLPTYLPWVQVSPSPQTSPLSPRGAETVRLTPVAVSVGGCEQLPACSGPWVLLALQVSQPLARDMFSLVVLLCHPGLPPSPQPSFLAHDTAHSTLWAGQCRFPASFRNLLSLF